MTQTPQPNQRIELAVIGTSAGGIEALLTLLDQLPSPWALPLVAVVHLPEVHDSHLSQLFARRLTLPVCEAQDKAAIMQGCLHFAPPGYHLLIERDRSFALSCEEPVLFSRPSIDLMMETAAKAYGPHLAGLLLTGASNDGALGMQAIAQHGGLTAVQDPEEAFVAHMPEAAIAQLAPAGPNRVQRLKYLRDWLLTLNTNYAY